MPKGIRKSKFKKGQMVEAIETGSIVVDGGVSIAIHKGDRMRSSEPAVVAAPQFFKALDPEFLPEVEQATAAPGERRGTPPTAA